VVISTSFSIRPKISDDKLRKFGEKHLVALATNNTANQYDLIINDTEAAYNSYFGAITDEDTLLALQQGRTISMNNTVKAFKDLVSTHEGAVRSKISQGQRNVREIFSAWRVGIPQRHAAERGKPDDAPRNSFHRPAG